MALTKPQAATILTRLSFRVNTNTRYNSAIKYFQRGWNLGPALTVDGVKGPKTDAALLLSEARRRRGLGTASAHFSFSEIGCRCRGRYYDCRRFWSPRKVLQALESSRRQYGAISIVSGNRCPNHNRAVGGVSDSQHVSGLAIDWKGPDKDRTRSWGIWHGIGYGGHSDRSLHTDLRTSASAARPMVWVYPGW